MKDGLFHHRGHVQKFSKEFLEDIPNHVPFVFVPTSETELVPQSPGNPLDLPFKSCFFEVLGCPITVVNEDKVIANIEGIFIQEISPRKYNVFNLMFFDGSYSVFAIHSSDAKVWQHMLGIIESLLIRLTHQETGVINPRHSVKFKIDGQKIHHRINKIVYVAPRSQRQLAQAHSPKEIDWSHRFEVRGHWRKIDMIGKDREGVYCVEGFTWVKEHVRGPEHLPLIKKTRIVQAAPRKS